MQKFCCKSNKNPHYVKLLLYWYLHFRTKSKYVIAAQEDHFGVYVAACSIVRFTKNNLGRRYFQWCDGCDTQIRPICESHVCVCVCLLNVFTLFLLADAGVDGDEADVSDNTDSQRSSHHHKSRRKTVSTSTRSDTDVSLDRLRTQGGAGSAVKVTAMTRSQTSPVDSSPSVKRKSTRLVYLAIRSNPFHFLTYHIRM